MSARGADYPLTHNLNNLLDRVIREFPEFEEFRDSIPAYSDFAVAMRYDEAMYPDLQTAQEAFET